MLWVDLGMNRSIADSKAERDVGSQYKDWWTVAAAGLLVGMADE